MQAILGQLAFAILIGTQFLAAIFIRRRGAGAVGRTSGANALQPPPPENRRHLSEFVQAAMLSAALLVGLCSQKSLADDLTDALVSHARHDDARAMKQLTILAESQNVVAQATLGSIYLTGDGAPRDGFAAFKWLKLAAEQGHAEAQFQLGEMFRDGIGTPADGKLAMVWFLRAAAQDVPHAYGAAGQLYVGHPDIAQDFHAALRWFIRGAALDDAASMYHLGMHYALGQGVEADPIEAYKWFDLAAKAALDSDLAAHARMVMAWQLTPLQVNEAKIRIQEWRATVLTVSPVGQTAIARAADAVLMRPASSWPDCQIGSRAAMPVTAPAKHSKGC